MDKIGILDYGMGNVGSIRNMLKHVSECEIVNVQKPEDMGKISKMILPGVGAFDAGMELLESGGMIEGIKDFAIRQKKPVLGICLGMQLLGNKSEEGQRPGLGLLDFDVVRFQTDGRKIPHMGWNYVQIEKKIPLFQGIEVEENRYYFVHSYHAVCKEKELSAMTCEYGYRFTAAVAKENIYGVQFHPEKSHAYGMKIMKNFAEVC